MILNKNFLCLGSYNYLLNMLHIYLAELNTLLMRLRLLKCIPKLVSYKCFLFIKKNVNFINGLTMPQNRTYFIIALSVFKSCSTVNFTSLQGKKKKISLSKIVIFDYNVNYGIDLNLSENAYFFIADVWSKTQSR